jgi:hypothetical protein
MALTRRDKAAMKLAIAQARKEGEGRAAQIDAKLKAEPFERVGSFAAYSCQYDALGLKPWQWPPCWIEPAEIEVELARGNDVHGRRGGGIREVSRSLGQTITSPPRSSPPW